jgi:hypothetical protein
MINWIRWGNKQSWPILRHYLSVFLEWLKKTIQNISQDRRCPTNRPPLVYKSEQSSCQTKENQENPHDWDSNQIPPKYNALNISLSFDVFKRENTFFRVGNRSLPVHSKVIIIIRGVRLSPLGTAATTCLLYRPQMIDGGDCGANCGMKIGRENRNTWKKRALAPLCPPQIPFDQTRTRTRAPRWEAGD